MHVAILLCVYNGANFIQEQLDSILSQTFENWTLFVYDDGSTDETELIVNNFQKQCKQDCFFIKNKERLGFARNFIHAVQQTPKSFDFFAFADHDDIFFPTKLESALSYLTQRPVDELSLYGTRTLLVNEKGQFINFSPCFKKALSFKNALLQNFAGGNTFVFNRALAHLVSKLDLKREIVSHDWFIYLLTAALGGHIYFDNKPSMYYRQHSKNAVGSGSSGILARWDRLKKVFNGQFKDWIHINIELLVPYYSLFTLDNKQLFNSLLSLESYSHALRFINFIRIGFYRQTTLETIAMYLAVLLKRI